MRNRAVGTLIIVIAVLMGFIIYSFNAALASIVNASCSHGPSCPMWGTINFQTNVSIGIMAFVFIIGLYLIFFGKEEKIIRKVVKQKVPVRRIDDKMINALNRDEKIIFKNIMEADGALLQSDLVEKTKFSKVKVTRLLDKLEGRGIIERQRRGMTNIVILKHRE